MAIIDVIGSFLGLTPNINPAVTLDKVLISTYKTHIIDKITAQFSTAINSPIINAVSSYISTNIGTLVNTPITSWFTNSAASLINSPIFSWITNNMAALVNNPIITSVNSYFSNNQLSVLNLSIASKNLLLNLFINPVIAKIPFLNPIDDPYKAEYDLEGVHVNTDSLFSDGSYYIGLITYDIFRRFFTAVYDVLQESSDWFNNNVAGTEIVFPIPLFSGKRIVIANKIGEVWHLNEDLNMPIITTWSELMEKQPQFDIFPFNVKLPDKVMFSNMSFIDDNGDTTPYKRSDLTYDFECLVIITAILYFLGKVGFAMHEKSILAKMTKAAKMKAQYGMIVNDITYKGTTNKGLMYLLMLLTRGSSANRTSVNLSLGNITGLEDVFEDLDVITDDDAIELLIKQDTESLLKRYMGGYT